MTATVNTFGVAEMLGKSVDWFYRNRARLVQRRGFPPEVVPGRWSRDAVRRWIDGEAPPADTLDAERAECERRARNIETYLLDGTEV